MLFNTYAFVIGFLPLVLGGFILIGRRDRMLAAAWLAAASLFFYAWWNPAFVGLLLGSIGFNYGASRLIVRARNASAGHPRALLTVAISANLLLLGYFKYANFFIATLNAAGTGIAPLDVVLPIGISFYTFTQIAFLVDTHRGLADESRWLHYVLFVTWFPHLIAGPVLHHSQMMPQFAHRETYRADPVSIATGLAMFAIGLSKKALLADPLAIPATAVFDAAAQGRSIGLGLAWVGVTAYALQLYFDFSGYSDMAIGISRMFNVRLPLNFNSPYKSRNIVEFWRRWHMTLSAFLRDYLYVPLGGNRRGRNRRYLNLMVTMMLGGLWHGAGWTFFIWGTLHGAYLAVYHLLRQLRPIGPLGGRLASALSTAFTFVAVLFAWVPFRANSMDAAWVLWRGMLGLNGLSLNGLESPVQAVAWIVVGLLIVWCLPNSQQWLARFQPASDAVEPTSRVAWRFTSRTGFATGVLVALALVGVLSATSEFLYYQF